MYQLTGRITAPPPVATTNRHIEDISFKTLLCKERKTLKGKNCKKEFPTLSVADKRKLNIGCLMAVENKIQQHLPHYPERRLHCGP
jgi:hypothetical protein